MSHFPDFMKLLRCMMLSEPDVFLFLEKVDNKAKLFSKDHEFCRIFIMIGITEALIRTLTRCNNNDVEIFAKPGPHSGFEPRTTLFEDSFVRGDC